MCQSFSYSYRDQHALPPLEPGLDPLLPLTRHQHTCLYNYNAKKKLNQNDKLYQTIHFFTLLLIFFPNTCITSFSTTVNQLTLRSTIKMPTIDKNGQEAFNRKIFFSQ